MAARMEGRCTEAMSARSNMVGRSGEEKQWVRRRTNAGGINKLWRGSLPTTERRAQVREADTVRARSEDISRGGSAVPLEWHRCAGTSILSLMRRTSRGGQVLMSLASPSRRSRVPALCQEHPRASRSIAGD